MSNWEMVEIDEFKISIDVCSMSNRLNQCDKSPYKCQRSSIAPMIDVGSIEVVQKIIIQIPEKFNRSHNSYTINQTMCIRCHTETRGVWSTLQSNHNRSNTCDLETLQFNQYSIDRRCDRLFYFSADLPTKTLVLPYLYKPFKPLFSCEVKAIILCSWRDTTPS